MNRSFIKEPRLGELPAGFEKALISLADFQMTASENKQYSKY